MSRLSFGLALSFLSLVPALVQAAPAAVAVIDDLVVTGDTVLAPGTYTVNDVHADGVIQIAADNVTLDGAGVVILGQGFRGSAIRMNGHTGLTLRHFTIRGFDYGIRIENASGLLLEENDVSGNRKDISTDFLDIGCGGCYGGGILLRKVRSSIVRGNVLTDQSTGLELIDSHGNQIYDNLTSEGPEGNEEHQNSAWGIRLDGSTHNLVRGNRADFVDRERYGFSSGDSAGILLVSGSHDNQIVSNAMTHSGDGFFLGNSCERASHRNYVYGNDGSFSPHNAFEATFSSGNVFESNWASDSDYGFWLGYSYSTRVTRNKILRNANPGIAIEHGHDNEIDRNVLAGNPIGVQLWAADTTCPWPECGASCPSRDYRIHHNAVTGSFQGLWIENTRGATIVRNRAIDNQRNLRLTGESSSLVVTSNDLTCHRGPACQSALDNQMPVGRDVNAVRNFWGTLTPSRVIFDHADDRSRGRVAFLPVLPEPIPADSGAYGPEIGVWTETTPLPRASSSSFPDRGQQLVVHAGFVYLFGGQSPGDPRSRSVWFARLLPDGTVASWNAAAPLPGSFTGSVAVQAGGRVYLIGRAGGSTAVYQAPLLGGEGVGSWSSAPPLPASGTGLAAAAFGGHIYVVSEGAAGFARFAKVQEDGSLSLWQSTAPLPPTVRGAVLAGSDGFLYAIASTGRVYLSSLRSDGGLNPWRETTRLPGPVASPAAFEHDGAVYVLAGASNRVWWAAVGADGSLGSWQSTTPLPEALRGLRTGAADGFVYTAGGRSGSAPRDTVRFAPLSFPVGCRGGETVEVPFARGEAGATARFTYQGLATLAVAGVGKGDDGRFRDAFYVFAEEDGTPIEPVHPEGPGHGLLTLGGQPIGELLAGQEIPLYRPDHRYTFRIEAPEGRPAFGVDAPAGADATGRYVIGLCGGTR